MKDDVSILRLKFEPVVARFDGAEASIGHKVFSQNTLVDTIPVRVKTRTSNVNPNGFKVSHADAVRALTPGSHVNGYEQGDKARKGLWFPTAFVSL